MYQYGVNKMVLKDINLLKEISEFKISDDCEHMKNPKDHILDDKIQGELNELCKLLENNDNIYSHEETIRKLWVKLIKKSIKCLRYYDRREPFFENDKKVPVVEINELITYFEHYTKSEGILYASSGKYRDHVIHAFRTWLVGMYILLTTSFTSDEKPMIEKIILDGVDIRVDTKIKPKEEDLLTEKDDCISEVTISKFEILSMWTLISLCHDLGYPFEKLKQINDNEHTKYFTAYFNFNPNVTVSVNFSNTQDKISQDVIRFMSSRTERDEIRKKYFVRSQPKYSNKFYDSLSKCFHGSISANVLFNTLLYFKESDYNTGTSYYFENNNDIVQYYIRREILRSIAIHTCHDIYHIKTTTMPFLLIVCDELQEWDRKTYDDFYKSKQDIESSVELVNISEKEVHIRETLKFKSASPNYKILFENYWTQYDYYQKIFRDGMDTKLREFSFLKEVDIEKKERICFKMNVSKDSTSTFSIHYESNGAKKEYRNEFGKIKEDIKKKFKLELKEEEHCSYLSYKED